MTKSINNSWLWWLGLLAIDLVSFISYGTEFSNWAVLVAVIVFAVVAIRSLPAALVLAIIELIVGSQGYWFKFEYGNTIISLRLAIFFVIMAVFLYHEIRRRNLAWLRDPIVKWWSLGAVAIVWGAVVGWQNNEFANWFLDLNGYLYIFIFLPLYQYRMAWLPQVKKVWLPAVLYLSFKTIGLFYLYSHFDPAILSPIYDWIRNSGWGEITYAGGNTFRIFSQSQIYLLVGTVLLLSNFLMTNDQGKLSSRLKVSDLILTLLVATALLISLSRSFWLAGAVAMLFSLAVLFFWTKKTLGYKLIDFGLVLLLLLSASGAVFAVSTFPWPKPLGMDTNFLIERANISAGDAAGASRLQLLRPLWNKVSVNWFFGSGFGSTVTYKTQDPRLVQSSAGGQAMYTTYAFEWGYLDTWLKLGLLGLVLYLWWWTRVGLSSLTVLKTNPLLAVLLAGALAVAAANMTTPYLNHPLGIGALTVLFIILYNEQYISR